MTDDDLKSLALDFRDQMVGIDLLRAVFQAGAASRDADIHRLQMALAATEALELGTSEKCDQLREQVAILREALLTCSVGDFSTGHVIYPSFDEKLVEEALAASEPKITKPTRVLMKSWSKKPSPPRNPK
jgi:hypothetical protein